MGRIGRSFQLVGQSYRLLMQDKELMVLPLLSGLCTAAVVVSFFVGFSLTLSEAERYDATFYLPLFLMYVVVYAVGIFFQAAVVAGATERMRGGDPTVWSALAAAGRRLGAIILWAVIAATVGVVLRAVQERVGFIGRIIVALVGAAWSLATMFVVPVLVLEDMSIPDSFTRSVAVFKKTWGESAVGAVNLGAAALVAWISLIAATGLLAWAGLGLFAIVLGGVGAIGLILFFSALQGIYVASLYQYATGGRAAAGFDPDMLAQAFRPK